MTSEREQTSTPGARWRTFTVRRWFLLALGVMGAMTLVTAGVGAAVLSRTNEAADRLVHNVAPARTAAFQLQAALLDQETGVRGFLLTGDETLLAPYERGRTAESGARAQLGTLVGEMGLRSDTLSALDGAVKRWQESFAVPAVAATRAHAGTVSVAQGKAEFDQVRTRLATVQRQLQTEQERAGSHLSDVRAQRDHTFLAALALFVLIGAGLALLLQFTVVRPLEEVRTASRRVADGDFDHPIPAHGPADVRGLSKAVEAMRLRVVGELTAGRRREAVLAEQATEMDAQAVELRRSNAELEQFAYVASHDLQEPLRKVASFCQLLEKRYGDRLDERGTQYIAFAVDGAKRMQTLINDLLTFSRVGRVNDACDALDTNTVVDRALRNLAAAVEEHDARIDCPEDLPGVTGDPTLLTMLWQNLLGNAVKFRHPDRVPHIRVSAEPDAEAGFVRFAVTDNGIGIAPEFAEKVFVIFQRLHSRDAYGGTGIGLSVCRKIVEHRGGRIWVDTAHTDGTRIVFTLPGVSAPDGSTLPAPQSEGVA
ncbi:sensor histidine kinase [Streptomyces sp. SID1034]|uniref:sensor histidine kinase n=1 Tax=Streptomyces sp. SID1034 TaxID=2690248 RepID=UPI0013687351|nr:sensor histidine kinase [Streptomyces sp. SID1034]MYV88941.1 HAMP domain-containing protein [Streptomyces sp. SID1034]